MTSYRACRGHLPAVAVANTIVGEGKREDVGDMDDADVDSDDRTTMTKIVLAVRTMVES